MRAPKLLCVASAVDLDFRYGCTPAWWQLWKGLHDEGADLIVTPYRGRPVETPSYHCYLAQGLKKTRIGVLREDGTGEALASPEALAASGETYITGSTASSNFPTTSGVVRVSNGGAAKTTDNGTTWAAENAGLTN